MSNDNDNIASNDNSTEEQTPIPQAAIKEEVPDILASLKQRSKEEAKKETQSEANSKVTTAHHIHTPESIKNIVEAAILAASKALSLDKICALFMDQESVSKEAVRQAIEQLMQDYESRGVELIEVSSGFRFQVVQSVAPWVSRLWEERPQKYSRALLETLALVAYRQPVTRGEIEEIRGVSVSSQIMRTLVEREWVRIIGHRDVPGKPAMYATTKTFLDYFGLKKLDELPPLSEIRDLDVINAELDFGDGATAQAVSSDSETDPESNDDSLANIAISVDVDSENDEQAPINERIDIDAELDALRETYQQMDAQEKKNTEQASNDTSDDMAENIDKGSN
ncbi:SMC-Scp complex subunit ScpB [sulfur-oxidizing endosymbiont of Gigantopelta aegis]|uniref:SMC-Scp complex subunit ScpB n=1 Tax=sulfur-oxidizing endosymbiont of Gigantopelta aegis TaxID=2794934 RepID=UPI0018DE0AEF|nr:SMC-Scp complex subunit ScpB [sulfur-oxidizing endosymbiont of Gigantopelta aegis]